MRRAVLLLGLFIGAAPASAQDFDRRILPRAPVYARNATCAPVSLSMPKSRHAAINGNLVCPTPADMPLTQGDSAMCFAYATADMISQRVGAVVSPMDVATKYYFADAARLALSTTSELRRELAALGDFDATVRHSRDTIDIAAAGNAAREPLFDKLEGGEEDIAALLYNIDGLCLDADLPSFDGYMFARDFLRRNFLRARFAPKPNLTPRAVATTSDRLRSPLADAYNAAWVAHTERSCRRRPSPVPLLPAAYRIAHDRQAVIEMLQEGRPISAAKKNRMMAMIDYALDNGRAPAVGYTYWVLEEREANDPDITADHSSVVLARRRANGVCQYQVQDNTGEYCAAMKPHIAARCENGRIWLTEGELREAAYSVVYLR